MQILGNQTRVLVCTAHALPGELSVSPAQELHVLKRTSKKEDQKSEVTGYELKRKHLVLIDRSQSQEHADVYEEGTCKLLTHVAYVPDINTTYTSPWFPTSWHGLI